MSRNKLNTKGIVLLHEYMHRNVYIAHHLRIVDDALLQAMSHINHTLIQFFGVMKIYLVYML